MIQGDGKLSDGPYECTPCQKRFTGPASYVEHRNSERHRRQSTPKSDLGTFGSDNFIKCEVCNTEISGLTNLEQHDKGRKHQNALAKIEQHLKSVGEQPKLPGIYSCPSNTAPPSVHPASPSLASTASATEHPSCHQPPLSSTFAISPAETAQSGVVAAGASNSTTDVNHHEGLTPGLGGPGIQVHPVVAPTALLQGNNNVQPVTAVPFTNLSLQVGSGPYHCSKCENRFMRPADYKQHSGSCTALENFIRCDACGTEISGAVNLYTHDRGKKHQKAMARFYQALAKAQNQPFATVSIPHSNRMVVASVTTPPCATSLLTVTTSGNAEQPLQHSEIEGANSSLRPEVLDPPDSSSNTLDNSTNESASATNFNPRVSAEPQLPFENGSNYNGTNISNTAKPSQGENQEASITSTYNVETEEKPPVSNFVSTKYNEAGTICKVGDLEGYACRKCKILLFEDKEASEFHYKMHSSSELTWGILRAAIN